MKKAIIILIVLIVDLTMVQAQENGIQFVNGSNWEQILAKAKVENKYIFLDCYASWCGPCKMMDKEVYTNDSVGSFLNANFISVKVQMDTSKMDNANVRMLYIDAHNLSISYNVNAYPTYLFFDPSGQIVHRSIGYQEAKEFMQVAKNSLTPDKQYYKLLRDYQNRAKDRTGIPDLVKMTMDFGEKELAMSIAKDYMYNDLDKLDEQDFLLKNNLDFIDRYAEVVTSKDRVFQLCFHQPALIDTAMHDSQYANNFVNNIIYRQEIVPALNISLKDKNEPQWAVLSQNIKRKFGKGYVEANILSAKIWWYQFIKDGPNYTKYLVQRIDQQFREQGIAKSDLRAAVFYNNYAFEIFKYDENKRDLQTALTWERKLDQIQPNPNGNFLDTEANLLYKLGKKAEALKIETQATAANPKDAEIEENFQKMKVGKPTWPENGMQ